MTSDYYYYYRYLYEQKKRTKNNFIWQQRGSKHLVHIE